MDDDNKITDDMQNKKPETVGDKMDEMAEMNDAKMPSSNSIPESKPVVESTPLAETSMPDMSSMPKEKPPKLSSGTSRNIIGVLLVLVLLAGAAFGGYNYAKKQAQKDADAKVADLQKQIDGLKAAQSAATQTTTDTSTTTSTAPQATYVDFRVNKKDGTGVSIKAVADISKLTSIGSDLKAYLEQNVGKQTKDLTGKSVATTYTIDRLYGNYAVGTSNSGNAYQVWGPKNGTGAIAVVAGTQNLGYSCDDLTAAKVPADLVDSKCLVTGQGLKDYK